MCDIMKKGSRYICGKIRTCKIYGDKIIDVYDDEKKIYVPCDEFLRRQEEHKTISDKKTNEIKDYEKEKEDKKTKEIKEDVEEDVDEDIDPYQWYVKKVFKKSVIL